MTSNRRNEHTLPSAIRFFKIITRTSLEDGKLRIPNSFTRKYGGDMSNPMFLKPPDGKEWNIYWTKHDGDIWFQKGLKEFATYYSLDHGHMVLFEHDETSHFGVHIFDKSTFEIQYPFHGSQDEQNINPDQISEEEDSVEILDEPPPCWKTTPKSRITPCPQSHKRMRTDTSKDVGRSSKLQNFLPKHVQVKEDMDGTTECLKVEQYLTSKITEAVIKTRNLRSENPSFTVVMKYTYLNQYLYVPSQFAKKYFKKDQSGILLQVLDERTWLAKYCLGQIRNGWKKFVLDNNLKVGDVCVFELTKSQALTLKVLIFPHEKEVPHSPPSQGRNPFPNEAGEEANKFTSENPSFTVNIKQNRWRPSIPSVFMRKYLDKKQNVLLRFWKKLWPVKLIDYPCKPTPRLSRGWRQFMKASKLQAGDVCVLELINREDALLDVHIFRGNS